METTRHRYEMSQSHKAQLAVGREQSRIVRNYLEALRSNHPKRGRKRSPETIGVQLRRISEKLSTETDAVHRLNLLAEKDRLEQERITLIKKSNLAVLERSFVSVAAEYSQRKGISYNVWRNLGVSASVLREAGIQRAA